MILLIKGTPATVYFRGSQQMITAIPIFFAICLAAHVFVPVFHPLQLKSTSEVRVQHARFQLKEL